MQTNGTPPRGRSIFGIAMAAFVAGITTLAVAAPGQAGGTTGGEEKLSAPVPQPPAKVKPKPVVAAPRGAFKLIATPAALVRAVREGQDVLENDQEIIVLSTERELRLVCDGKKKVVVLGSGNIITLTGATAPLMVSGSENLISVEKVSSIEMRGGENRIFWNSGLMHAAGAADPRVVDGGKDNLILPVEYL